METQTHRAAIWAIGGGKGGVGKSFVMTCLGAYIASAGKRVVLIDGDPGGANLHTFFGIHRPKTSLTDFFEKNLPLSEQLIDCGVPNLKLLTGVVRSLSSETFNVAQQYKLIRHLRKLDADYVMIDLGAGTHWYTLDMFIAADKMIAVTTPDIIAIENLYQFLQQAFFRRLIAGADDSADREAIKLAWKKREEYGIVNLSQFTEYLTGVSEAFSRMVQNRLSEFTVSLIVNQTRTPEDLNIGHAIRSICRNYLNLNTEYAGAVGHDPNVMACINSGQPFMRVYPDSPCAKGIETVSQMLARPSQPRRSENEPPNRYGQFLEVLECPPGASMPQIRASYQLLKSLYSSDSVMTLPLTDEIPENRRKEMLCRIEDAWHSLLVMIESEHSTGIADKQTPEEAEFPEYSGPVLRKIRETRKITIDTVASETRIQAQSIENIELERYDQLPPEVFIKGFVGIYAKFLNLDSKQVVSDYMTRYRAWRNRSQQQ